MVAAAVKAVEKPGESQRCKCHCAGDSRVSGRPAVQSRQTNIVGCHSPHRDESPLNQDILHKRFCQDPFGRIPNTVNSVLRKAAEDAARKARFNTVDGVTNQTGTILSLIHILLLYEGSEDIGGELKRESSYS